jgi:hypothetical protein
MPLSPGPKEPLECHLTAELLVGVLLHLVVLVAATAFFGPLVLQPGSVVFKVAMGVPFLIVGGIEVVYLAAIARILFKRRRTQPLPAPVASLTEPARFF